MSGWPEAAPLGRRLDVVRELAVAEFRLKYHDSVLGYSWSMLSPLLMLATYYLVFRHIIGVTTPGYLVYLMVGIVYWTFFQDCTFSGLNALAGKAALLRAVHVPPVWLVLAGACSTAITLAINTAVLVAVLGGLGRLSPLAPLALLPLLCLLALATGISLIVALAYVSFRDMGLIWNVLLQAAFWLTPIVYVVPDGLLAEILYLNPLARCLHLIRWFLVYDYMPSARFLVLTVAACAGVLAGALALFLRRQAAIPEAL
jgi:ABC-type polysaccharide/polyol phosphate export permease